MYDVPPSFDLSAAICISLEFSLATLDLRDYGLIEGLNVTRL